MLSLLSKALTFGDIRVASSALLCIIIIVVVVVCLFRESHKSLKRITSLVIWADSFITCLVLCK